MNFELQIRGGVIQTFRVCFARVYNNIINTLPTQTELPYAAYAMLRQELLCYVIIIKSVDSVRLQDMLIIMSTISLKLREDKL